MPVSTRKFGIRVAEGDVQPRHLFILQEVAYQPLEAGERANGKFARAVAVGCGEEIVAHLFRQIRVLAGDIGDIAIFDGDGDGLCEYAVFR